MCGFRVWFFIFAVLISVGQLRADIDIVFDYSFDTNNFFSSPQSREALDAAAGVYEEVIKDSLDAAIDYYGDGGWNTWEARFYHPSTGELIYFDSDDFAYPIIEDRVVIFVGGDELDGGAVGIGGYGGYRVSGYTQDWFDLVKSRGEIGALGGVNATDFGPWGGAISFDLSTDWHIDHTVNPSGNDNDLYSVALHEIGHVLGFGSAESWDANLSDNVFTGTNSVNEYGSVVPLDAGSSHWFEGTISPLLAGGMQEAAMDPTLTIGTRKELTLLDYAGLKDVGWEIELIDPYGDCIVGDINCDGVVGLIDLDILGAHYGDIGVGWGEGDLNGNGSVTLLDLDILGNNWGNVGMVPEPCGLVMLVIASVLIRRNCASV